MNINKFHDEDNKPFHSSGYAEAARGDMIGSTSSESFTQRNHIDRNRQSVAKYRHSLIAHGHRRDSHFQRIDIVRSNFRPQQDIQTEQESSNKSTSSLGQRAATPPTTGYKRPEIRQRYTEPPTRGYNPYQ